VPRIRRDISGRETLVTIFFLSRWLLMLKIRTKRTKFNQSYLIDGIFPELHSEKRRNSRKKRFPAFSVLTDDSMCHNDHKVS
jgi:hypothetical protein